MLDALVNDDPVGFEIGASPVIAGVVTVVETAQVEQGVLEKSSLETIELAELAKTIARLEPEAWEGSSVTLGEDLTLDEEVVPDIRCRELDPIVIERA